MINRLYFFILILAGSQAFAAGKEVIDPYLNQENLELSLPTARRYVIVERKGAGKFFNVITGGGAHKTEIVPVNNIVIHKILEVQRDYTRVSYSSPSGDCKSCWIVNNEIAFVLRNKTDAVAPKAPAPTAPQNVQPVMKVAPAPVAQPVPTPVVQAPLAPPASEEAQPVAQPEPTMNFSPLTIIPIRDHITLQYNAGSEIPTSIAMGQLKVIKDLGDYVQVLLINHPQYPGNHAAMISHSELEKMVSADAMWSQEGVSPSVMDVPATMAATPTYEYEVGNEFMVPAGKFLSVQNTQKKFELLPPGTIVKIKQVKDPRAKGIRSWAYEIETQASPDSAIRTGTKYYTSDYNFPLLEEVAEEQEQTSEATEIEAAIQSQETTVERIKTSLTADYESREVCEYEMGTMGRLKTFEDRALASELTRFKSEAELAVYLECYNSSDDYQRYVKNYQPLIQKAAQEFQLPTALLACLLMRESRFRPNANSGKARGIAQFTNPTLVYLNNLIYNTDSKDSLVKEQENWLNSFLADHGADPKSWTAEQTREYRSRRTILQRYQSMVDSKRQWSAYFDGKPPSGLVPGDALNPKKAIAAAAFYMKYILRKVDFELNYFQSGNFSVRPESDSKRKTAKNLTAVDLSVLATGLYNAGPFKVSRVFKATPGASFDSMVAHTFTETRNHMSSIRKCAEASNRECMTGTSKSVCDKNKACYDAKWKP